MSWPQCVPKVSTNHRKLSIRSTRQGRQRLEEREVGDERKEGPWVPSIFWDASSPTSALSLTTVCLWCDIYTQL